MVSKLHASAEFLSVKKDVGMFTNIILLKKTAMYLTERALDVPYLNSMG